MKSLIIVLTVKTDLPIFRLFNSSTNEIPKEYFPHKVCFSMFVVKCNTNIRICKHSLCNPTQTIWKHI